MDAHFLGIDLGSSYTKFCVIDNNGSVVHSAVVPTLSRRRNAYDEALDYIRTQFDPLQTCATGYGRKSSGIPLTKTELICASAGISVSRPIHKSLLDIGGEDIKIVESGEKGEVIKFFMNDKCSAGTGTFITEIAARAELTADEMTALARESSSSRIMNSFCTVFAKSEILGWKLGNVPIEDIARGIYLSVIDRIGKLPMRTDLPIFLCGGVIAYHPYLADLLAEALGVQVQIVDDPQYAVALGAAVLAAKEYVSVSKRESSGNNHKQRSIAKE